MFPWQRFASDPIKQNQIALRDPQGEVFTWRQLFEQISQYAKLLQYHGVQPNSGVALCGKNELDLLLLYLATIQIGARVFPLNPAFPVEKFSNIAVRQILSFIMRHMPYSYVTAKRFR